MDLGATCSTRCVAVCTGELRNAESEAGMPVGTTPPGVNWPISFGTTYPIAVATALPPRPRRPAIPESVVLPNAFSTSGADSAAPSVLPSHEATCEPRPADLNLLINPPIPPGESVIRLGDFAQ